MPVTEEKKETLLYRVATMPRQAIDEQARTVELSFSSEDPYDRGVWGGVEILGHDKGEVNMERLKTGTHPLLLQHDPDQQIGVIEKAWIDGEEKKGRAKVRFAGPTNQLAEMVYQDVLNGIRSNVSVGYVIEKKKTIQDDETEAGPEVEQEFPGKYVWRATRWTPMEISIVSIPADYKAVGIGKAVEDVTKKEPDKPTSSTAEEPKKKEPEAPQILARKHMTEPDQKEKERIELEEKQAREKAEAEARQREKRLAFVKKQADDRVKEIYAIGSRFGCEKLKQQAIEEGWSVDKFRSVLLESMDEGKIIRQPDTQSGSQETKSIGQCFVDSPMYKELARRTGTRRVIQMDLPRIEFRASPLSAATEGLTSIQKLPGIPGLLDQQQLRVAQIIPTTTTDSTTIRYIQEDTYTNAAAGVQESGAKPLVTLDVSEVDAAVRKVACYAITTEEMLADYSQMRGFIDGRLSYMVQATEENYLLNGTGVNPQITGLFS